MGCSLAYHLARAGRRVVVIDRGRIGQGATAACAGAYAVAVSGDWEGLPSREDLAVMRTAEDVVR